MRRVCIVQARTTSTRLPGKVLMDVAGRPMLTQQLKRLKQCRAIDDITVATTLNDADDPIVALARGEDVRWFRGSEYDVLSRYVGAARESSADIAVRITSDCPLIDPEETDRVVLELESHTDKCDYAANTVERTFPRGLDVEAFFRDTLERIGRVARSSPAREHVTFFLLQERPDLFLVRSVKDVQDNSDLRWTVDTPEDLVLIRQVYEDLDLGLRFMSYRTILAYVRQHPTLMAINAAVKQKQV